MYSNLPDNINLPQIESEMLRFWAKDKTFEKSVNEKDPDKHFTFYEGPPTANGMPGIHHVIARTVKDIICRYKTMQGYRVNRKAGWDTHGLPVEVEVEKQLGLGSRDEIYEFGAAKFNEECKKSIFKYLEQWEILTHKMAYWINLDDAYVTFHNEYIESVWWALKKFYDEGLMVKGFKIQPFCPVCESPLSSHEVAQGYMDLKDPSVYIKFRIKSKELEDTDFLVWTTTPWTLLSNVSVCVNPEADYVQIDTVKGKLILAEARLQAVSEEYKIIAKYKGSELENMEYEPLFNFFDFGEKAYYVTTGDFVTLDDGTGIVHIAPAFGEDDYNIGQKYNLPLLQAVLRNGNFRKETGKYAGKNFKETDPEIILDLKQAGRLYKKEMFTHSYPHCWRHKKPLMYYATDSWFIRTSTYKEKMIGLNRQINWNPEEFGTGRFGNWLEENKDWALSRNRFWGTPLPIWYYKDKNDKEIYECIGSIEELKKKAINIDEVYKDIPFDLHKPYIDDLKLHSEDGQEMKRVPEVIDCWFDSGSMPFAQFHYPFENKEWFEQNYPGDFIAEGLDQTRGWFYSLHAIGTFLFGKPAYKNLIVNGLIMDKNGKKMSKSLGNAVDPFKMMDVHGADVLRWYLVGNSPIWKSKNFNEDELTEVKNKFFDTLINTYRFFVIYSNMNGFIYNPDLVSDVNDRTEIDRWIISKLNTLKKNYFENLENYEITRAVRYLYDFTIDELSNWYVRRNRKRFRNPANKSDRDYAYQTLYECLKEIMKMLAPVSPFLSDKLYRNLTDGEKSVHLTEFTGHNEQYIDSALEEKMKIAEDIVYLVRAVRVKNNLKVRQPLSQLLVPVLNKHDREMILGVKDIILDEINVKELNIIEGDSDIIVKKAKPNFKSIGPKFGKDVKKIQQLILSFGKEEISAVEKNGKILRDNFEIERSDIEIFTENIEGWIVESSGGITIALDTKLNDILLNEGIIREFINRIQNYRKSNGFDVNDRIKVNIKVNEKIRNIIYNNFETIKNEIGCDEISDEVKSEQEYYKTDINEYECEFLIHKV
jgi:isoleucyl-tRNA synthetase